MRHQSFCFPWRHAYVGASFDKSSRSSRHDAYETRWHGRGANFGVRRPLRYLSHRLDLDENQVRRMATVLNSLKTEREQAVLDEKRSIASVAALLSEGTPTLEECRQSLAGRLDSSTRLNDETAKALVAISDLLDEDQQAEFVTLLLSGDFAI